MKQTSTRGSRATRSAPFSVYLAPGVPWERDLIAMLTAPGARKQEILRRLLQAGIESAGSPTAREAGQREARRRQAAGEGAFVPLAPAPGRSAVTSGDVTSQQEIAEWDAGLNAPGVGSTPRSLAGREDGLAGEPGQPELGGEVEVAALEGGVPNLGALFGEDD